MARETADLDSGEIVKEPNFVKLYIDDLCRIKGLSANQHTIFSFMLQNMNWDNIVGYGAFTKKKFLTENDIANQTFNNNVASLVSANLIERVGRGEFRINKKYAVKVEWSKVQSIKWTTEYTAKGRVSNVEIETSSKQELKTIKQAEFESLFADYGRKGNKKTALGRFMALKKSDVKKLKDHIHLYIESTPTLKYRLGLESYILKEAWDDEIIKPTVGMPKNGYDRPYSLDELGDAFINGED